VIRAAFAPLVGGAQPGDARFAGLRQRGASPGVGETSPPTWRPAPWRP